MQMCASEARLAGFTPDRGKGHTGIQKLIRPEPARPTEVSSLCPALSSVERMAGVWNLGPLLQTFLSTASTRTLGSHPHLLPGPLCLAASRCGLLAKWLVSGS